MIDIKYMNKQEASRRYIKLEENDFLYYKKEEFNENYLNLRLKLKNEFDNVIKNYVSPYLIDLHFGLKVFEIMNTIFNLDKNISLASNLEFWIYITIEIAPDITYKRWGNRKNRFFDSSKRVWIYSLWWYIYLSWQGSYEETRQTIYKFSTDTIVQIFERSGSGFDVELTRELMRKLSYEYNKTSQLRKVMVLNTIYLRTIEPKLYTGGIQGYVKMLFNKVKS